jgi:glycosyltransferase involved in cell wall biosynthesis
MKPRILVLVDVPGWALDRTADNVIRRLSHRYRFIKAFNTEAEAALDRANFDLAYLCYWRQFQDAGIERTVPRPAVTGVRSHFKWDGGRGLPPSGMLIDVLRRFDAVNVPSRILYDIFRYRHPAVFYTPHGVDETIFSPGRRKPPAAGSLVLGWAGSLNNHPGKRGIDDFLLPALEGLSGVELRLAAREKVMRTQAEMVEFYRGLDAYICTSRTEGGPHPLLEAAACGVPLISTPVGLAPQLIRDGDNGLLIERDVSAIRRAVTVLRDQRGLRVSMGRRAREIIERAWTWDIQAPAYIDFFERGLAQATPAATRRI